jgi:hypothetical protein
MFESCRDRQFLLLPQGSVNPAIDALDLQGAVRRRVDSSNISALIHRKQDSRRHESR